MLLRGQTWHGLKSTFVLIYGVEEGLYKHLPTRHFNSYFYWSTAATFLISCNLLLSNFGESAATAWCYHANMDQNLRVMCLALCWIHAKNEGSFEGKRGSSVCIFLWLLKSVFTFLLPDVANVLDPHCATHLHSSYTCTSCVNKAPYSSHISLHVWDHISLMNNSKHDTFLFCIFPVALNVSELRQMLSLRTFNSTDDITDCCCSTVCFSGSHLTCCSFYIVFLPG